MSKFVLQAETPRDAPEWGTLAWLSNPPSTGSRHLTVVDVAQAPGEGHNFHRHPRQEEVIFVVSGKVEQWIEREKRILAPGDAVYVDTGSVHAFFNVGDSDAKLLAILGPCIGDIGYEIEEVAEIPPCNSLR